MHRQQSGPVGRWDLQSNDGTWDTVQPGHGMVISLSYGTQYSLVWHGTDAIDVILQHDMTLCHAFS